MVAKVKSTALVWTIWLEKKDFEAAAQHFGVLGASCSFAPLQVPLPGRQHERHLQHVGAHKAAGVFNPLLKRASLAKRRPTLLWASGSISLPLFPVWLVGWRDPVCTAARWRSARQGRTALRIIDGVGKTRPRQPVLTGSLRQAHRGQRDHNRVRRAMSRRRRQFL